MLARNHPYRHSAAMSSATVESMALRSAKRTGSPELLWLMAKNVKSQWDFGELFDPATTRRVLTVSELTATVRRLLEKEVGRIWIAGEVTNLRLQGSGHVYFTL